MSRQDVAAALIPIENELLNLRDTMEPGECSYAAELVVKAIQSSCPNVNAWYECAYFSREDMGPMTSDMIWTKNRQMMGLFNMHVIENGEIDRAYPSYNYHYYVGVSAENNPDQEAYIIDLMAPRDPRCIDDFLIPADEYVDTLYDINTDVIMKGAEMFAYVTEECGEIFDEVYRTIKRVAPKQHSHQHICREYVRRKNFSKNFGFSLDKTFAFAYSIFSRRTESQDDNQVAPHRF